MRSAVRWKFIFISTHFLPFADIQLSGIGGMDMRIITTRKVNTLALIAISALVLLIIALYIFGNVISSNRKAALTDDAVDTIEKVDNYKVRSELLMGAMKYVGVCSPEETADIWVEGLIKRSAAIQYAVMNDTVRAEYIKHLEKSAPNWVTGMSSPWVSGYEVVKSESPDENTRVVKITVHTETSTGPAGNYNAVLTVAKEESFWRITKLALDEELYPYTGFTLN